MAVAGREPWNEPSAALPAQDWTHKEEEEPDVLDYWKENCASPISSSTIDRCLLEPLYDSTELLRLFDEEEDKDKESGFLDGYDAVYISEEEEILNSSDKDPEEKDAIAECVHSMKRLKKLNTDLQKSLDVSEDCISVFRAENTALKKKMNILRQLTQDDRNLKDELDNVRAAKLEQEQICSALEASKKQLEKTNETLKDQKEVIASEMSSILAEKEVYKKKSEELSQLLTAFQQEMEESRLHHSQANELIQEKDVLIKHLEDTILEYRTIKQDMKEKIQDLEDQLALALVNGSGCNFMNVDNTLSADVQHSVSLGEELGLLPVSKMNCPSQDEDTEHELELKIEKVQRVDEANTSQENVSQPHHQIRWQMERIENLKKMARAARVLGIGFLVPLGLLKVLLPVLCSRAGLSCADFICLTACRLIEPYFTVYHIGLPPV